MKNYYRS